jgi:membrane protein YfhO
MAGLAVIVVCLFWRVLFTSDMLYFRDIFNYSYPHAKLIHDVCRADHLPYWNPYLNWGQPLLANPNTLFFYPYTLMIILLPVNIAYPLHYVVHFSIAALGTYVLARRWGQTVQAAYFAGAFFAFSGPLLSLGNLYNMAACVAWMPWALYFTDWAIEWRSSRPWILLTLVFTLQFLAGEPMTLMATFGLAMAYALHRGGGMRRPASLPNLSMLTGFFLVGILMLALAAVQFLPSLQLLSNSRRGSGLTFWQAGYWSFHPFLFLEFVISDFFGPPIGEVIAWKTSLNSDAVPFLLSFFLGFIPIFLALAAWVTVRDRRRNFAAGGIAVFLLLALGRFTPLYGLLFSAFPPLRLVRFPVKLLLPAVLLTALLAGLGFDNLRRSTGGNGATSKLRIILMTVLAASSMVWGLAWLQPEWISAPARWTLVSANRTFTVPPDKPLTPAEVFSAMQYFVMMIRIHFPGLIGYSLGALAWLMSLERGKKWARQATPWIACAGVLTLVYVNYSINPVAPKSFYHYRPPVLTHFESSSQPYRFCDIAHDRKAVHQAPPLAQFINFDSVPETSGFSSALLSAFREKILLSSGTMLEGLESATSSDVDSSVSEPYYQFWDFERAQAGDKVRYDCLLGRANVKYIISRAPEVSAQTREITEIFNGSPAPSYLYEDLCATPRAFAAGAALFSSSAEETLAKLSDPEFDAVGQVILPASTRTSIGAGKPGPAGTIEITGRRPSDVSLRANLAKPGYVVLLDRNDPNWRATLDGKEVAVLPANVMFRAVECPAGVHQIRFYYHQKGLASGAAISFITMTFLLLIFWRNPKLPFLQEPN